MQKGNVNGALHLILQMLSLKHPEVQPAIHETMLKGPKRQIHSIIYEDIDEDLSEKAAIKAK